MEAESIRKGDPTNSVPSPEIPGPYKYPDAAHSPHEDGHEARCWRERKMRMRKVATYSMRTARTRYARAFCSVSMVESAWAEEKRKLICSQAGLKDHGRTGSFWAKGLY